MSLALSGTLLSGRFKVEERLGTEGRFEIFRAVEETSRRRVIVRLLDLEERADAFLHPDIEQAAKAMMALTHPGLVPVLGAGGHRARPFIVTPALELPTLDRVLAQGQLSLPETLRLLGQIGEALDHAHRAGVAHGELTTASILVPKEGRALLADAGLAHWVDLATSKSRPQHVPPPLRPVSADLDALRRIAERLIAIRQPSSPPAPLLSMASGVNPAPVGAWSLPSLAPNQRISMPVVAPSTPPPPAAAPRISQPPAAMEAAPTMFLPISRPPAAAYPSEPPTITVPQVAPALHTAAPASNGLAAALGSPVAITAEPPPLPLPGTTTAFAMPATPAPPQSNEPSNVPTDTVQMHLIPRPGPAHWTPIADDEPSTSTVLTPRYVLIAGRAASEAARGLGLVRDLIARQIEVLGRKSPHVQRAAELGRRGLDKIAVLFEERPQDHRAFSSADAAEPSVVDLRAAGLSGGWYSWPRSKRIAIASAGVASLFFLLLVAGSPSSPPEHGPQVIPELPRRAAAVTVKEPSARLEPPAPPPKSNVERLKEERKK